MTSALPRQGSRERPKRDTRKTERRWRVAAVQMTSTSDVEANLETAVGACERAARAGAALVAFPENFAWMRDPRSRARRSEPLSGPIVTRMRDAARRLELWILAGSFPERIARSPRIHNTSVLIDPDGEIEAVYRKMHLFDVRLRGRAVFEESRIVVPGRQWVLADTALGRLGLSVCYDLRFPELYRRLALAGAQILFVPSAFTAYTGRDHWMPLLRARAIENQCWVVAPAQSGLHAPRRETHGHTAVVDPWGKVVALRRKGPGLVMATIDLREQETIRRGLSCLGHARPELMGM